MNKHKAIMSMCVTVIVMFLMALKVASQPAIAQELSLSGTFSIIWIEPPPDSNESCEIKYLLFDDQGGKTEILLDETQITSLGGPQALFGKRVIVEGDIMSTNNGAIKARSIQFEKDGADVFSAGFAPIIGNHKYVTILCRYNDIPDTPQPVSYFDTLMGNTYPGMDHYWRQNSYNKMDLIGSKTVGWYTFPEPVSYYDSLWKMMDDAIKLADPDVYFPDFYGINVCTNFGNIASAWGDNRTIDGQTKFYGVSWNGPRSYNNHRIFAHEMGHTFGLYHSSGSCASTYDSLWDVMSGGGFCIRDPNYGCIGVHTISYHKNMLGWISSSQKYTAPANSTRTIILEPQNGPPWNVNYLMAQIPIGGSSTNFYTVESRTKGGYDSGIPGIAVVIHEVDRTRGDRQAQVVDVDGNCNPNDDGAMWVPNETFKDFQNKIMVSVDKVDLAGFHVTINTGEFFPSEPNIIISATSHDFGNMGIGNTSTSQTFTISNIGDADLNIWTISLTGTDASDFVILAENCAGLVFAPLDTCTIDVTFSPISIGVKSANLSITSNDPDTPILDVPLSGTGFYPPNVDNDGDGYTMWLGDCNDNDPNINPGACDIKGDFIDQDCDGTDRTTGKPCSDSGGGGQEICDDGIDNDGDGKVDCADKKDCGKDPACSGGGGQEICDDGIDNDGDGKVDCADKKDCKNDPACTN